MKILQTLATSLTFAVAMGQPMGAAAASGSLDKEWLTASFADNAALQQAQPLDEAAMVESRGQMAPLIGVVAGIAGLDLALMGFYWGYYVPTISSFGGACTGCNLVFHDQ